MVVVEGGRSELSVRTIGSSRNQTFDYFYSSSLQILQRDAF